MNEQEPALAVPQDFRDWTYKPEIPMHPWISLHTVGLLAVLGAATLLQVALLVAD